MANQEDKKFELIKNQVKLLAPSFSTVQIFTSIVNDKGSTVSYSWGTGNYNARYGQVVRWIKEEDANDVRNDAEEPE